MAGEPGPAEESGEEAFEGLASCSSEEALRFFGGEADSGGSECEDFDTPLVMGAEDGGSTAVGAGSGAPLPFCSAVALSKRARISAVIASYSSNLSVAKKLGVDIGRCADLL